MHKLSELVKFKNKLSEIIVDLQSTVEIDDKICKINIVKEQSTIAYDNNLNNIITDYQNLIKSNNEIVNTVKDLILLVDEDIATVAAQLTSSVEYNQMFNLNMPPADNFVKLANKEILEIIKFKIKNYCDWHYAGLNIYPSSKEWIDCMVMCDPLYLISNFDGYIYDINGVNVSQTLIKSAISSYTEIYQKRLRLYACGNLNFNQLPKNQFGFVLCWSVANYLPILDIERLIKETFDLLRPGGIFMFSYNNCELEESAKLVEHLAMSYSTAEKIKNICLSIGYEIVNVEDINIQDGFHTYISWIEIRKPGKLTTVKAHQVIGKIIEK